MVEQSVQIFRPVINHEEIFEHYSSQPHLKRIIKPENLILSLAHTQRKFDHNSISKQLETSYHIIPTHKESKRSNGYRQHTVFGQRTKTLSIELTSPEFTLRQASLHSQKITFFEIEDFKPHIALDFDFDLILTPEELLEIEVFPNRIYFDGEILSEAPQDFRSVISYRNIKK